MDRLYLLSWYYQGQDGESEARNFFRKLREGIEAGQEFPFKCSHQVGLVFSEVDPHWCVGVLVMLGTPGDDSVEQTDTLLKWFEKCDADYAGTDRTGIQAAGTTIESTLHTRYGSHYKIVDIFDTDSLLPTVSQPEASPAAVQQPSDDDSATPPITPASKVENYKTLFSDQEWKILQFSIYWVFRQLFLIHHIGKIDNITEAQKKALGKILSTVSLIKSDLARQVLVELTDSRDMFTKIWGECFMDPKHPADGLIDVAKLVDSKVPANVSLEFKRTLLTLGRFIDQEHGEFAGKKTSGKSGSLSEGRQALIVIGSSLGIPEKELMDDLFGSPMDVYDLDTAKAKLAALSSATSPPIKPSADAGKQTVPATPENIPPQDSQNKTDKSSSISNVEVARTFAEKDNLGTRYDTMSRGTTYWHSRMMQGPDHPFVIYYFDKEDDAKDALLELPCIHVAKDSGKLICTEMLDFGYYQKESGEFAAFISGLDLTYEQWELAKEGFARHGGEYVNDLEPEKRSAPAQESAVAQPDQVVFVREETKTGSMGETVVHRIYRGPDAASAQAFLKENPVTQQFHYLVVETPDGKYCRDIQGFYKLEADVPKDDNCSQAEAQDQQKSVPAVTSGASLKPKRSLLAVALGVVVLFVLCLVVILAGSFLLKPMTTFTSAIKTPAVVANTTFAPQPGVWRARAEFGEFTFVVNSKGTGVIEYDFGGTNVKTDDDEGYPITNSEFGSYLSFISINGKFESNTSASGTWEYIGKSGSGAWTAAWVGEGIAVAPTEPVFTPTSNAPLENISEIYLSEIQPDFVELGYGEYSVGEFQFSSEDPGDNVSFGDPITFHNITYPHGIFAHAPSRLVYMLGKNNFTHFSVTIGLVERIDCGDGVEFIVLLDDEEIYRSQTLYPTSPPSEIEIQTPFANADNITLVTEAGTANDNRCDWAIWGDPLLR